jgi:hypothetical protein
MFGCQPNTSSIPRRQDVLNLVLAKGYLAKLLENELVAQYLRQRQPDLLAEFETIVETVSLEQQQFSVVT